MKTSVALKYFCNNYIGTKTKSCTRVNKDFYILLSILFQVYFLASRVKTSDKFVTFEQSRADFPKGG